MQASERLKSEVGRYGWYALLVLGGCATAGLAIVGVAGTPSLARVLLALAMLALGALVGLLFGVPRSANPSGDRRPEAQFLANTNIEKVSDWLTTIIVGLTLINLQRVPGLVRGVAWYFCVKLDGTSTSEGLAAATIVYFFVAGFLIGYLATRLYLSGAFVLADGTFSRIDVMRTQALQLVPIRFDRHVGVTDEVRAEAERVQEVNLDTLDKAEDIGLWAKAGLTLGQFDRAIKGYSRALAIKPNDAQMRVERAIALRKAGSPQDKILEELEAAYVASANDPTSRRRAIEGLMYNYLYLPAPRGFERALEYGESYLADPRSIDSAAVWIYMAAATGQKYSWSTNLGVPAEQLEDLRGKALDALTTGLSLDSSWTEVVRSMLEGTGGDDDLASFREDPDFRSLVGLSALSEAT